MLAINFITGLFSVDFFRIGLASLEVVLRSKGGQAYIWKEFRIWKFVENRLELRLPKHADVKRQNKFYTET